MPPSVGLLLAERIHQTYRFGLSREAFYRNNVTLFIIAENPYRDRIEGDILLYTAPGREGDQQLAGRNKRLIKQYSNPVPFYGFMNTGHQTYRFLGLLELLRHYRESQADRRGMLRQVWLFEFRIHAQPDVVPVDHAGAISATLLSERAEIHYLSVEREVADGVQEAEPSGRHPPSRRRFCAAA